MNRFSATPDLAKQAKQMAKRAVRELTMPPDRAKRLSEDLAQELFEATWSAALDDDVWAKIAKKFGLPEAAREDPDERDIAVLPDKPIQRICASAIAFGPYRANVATASCQSVFWSVIEQISTQLKMVDFGDNFAPKPDQVIDQRR